MGRERKRKAHRIARVRREGGETGCAARTIFTRSSTTGAFSRNWACVHRRRGPSLGADSHSAARLRPKEISGACEKAAHLDGPALDHVDVVVRRIVP